MVGLGKHVVYKSAVLSSTTGSPPCRGGGGWLRPHGLGNTNYKLAVVLRIHLKRFAPEMIPRQARYSVYVGMIWLAERACTRADVALRTR